MHRFNALIRRLLRARGLVLLLAMLPVTVFSLVLNDRREFVLPAEFPAKAFAAASGQGAGTGVVPVIGGLVIRPAVPGEAPRIVEQPFAGSGIESLRPAPAGNRVLALGQPGGFAPLDYAPGQAIRLPNQRGLPSLRETNPLTGGGIGLLSLTQGPTNPGGPSGIPEPESWALMALGLGIVGFAMRRRIRAELLTAA